MSFGTPHVGGARGAPSARSPAAAGKTGFNRHLGDMANRFLGKSVQLMRVLADGTFAVPDCHRRWSVLQDYAGIDIIRPEEQGRISGHWDVLIEIRKEIAVANGMF